MKKHLHYDLTKVYDFSNISKDYARACHSLVDIQEYFDLDPLDLAKGHITNYENGQMYKAASELKSLDLFNIAKEARKAYNYEGAVKWLKVTLKLLKDEGQLLSHVSKVRKFLQETKEEHDSLFWETDFSNVASQPYLINESPYFLGNGDTDQENSLRDQSLTSNSCFDNLAENFTYSAPMSDPKLKSTFYFLRKRTRKLCQNTVS